MAISFLATLSVAFCASSQNLHIYDQQTILDLLSFWLSKWIPASSMISVVVSWSDWKLRWLTACLWYRIFLLMDFKPTPATLTSQPLMKFPSGRVDKTPLSTGPLSTTANSENLILSSYPDAVGIPDTIISSTSFWDFMDSFFRFVISSLSSEDDICFFAKDSKNYKSQDL